ncbi:heterokaryon incompatibility protein-domain-containing protein [Dendryphion nanum]|uniref:Heterokaryon incompatibility protein-domain-containing protein n=1 Tax=Dendryphion nanum TaxID=256645 RepID=A0A9P9ICX4_9PLEO|nr:heterokaryon incompatibility protein-domain-containing protein [Dendryphion nanum]
MQQSCIVPSRSLTNKSRSTGAQKAKSLVCDRCWDNLFNTLEYQKLCLRQNTDVSPVYTSLLRDIQESATVGCQYCSMILKVTNPEYLEIPDMVCRVEFYPSTVPPHHPTGNNVWRFSSSIYNETSHPGDGLGRGIHTIFSAYATENDNASVYITARPKQSDVSSELARNQIQTWIEECNYHLCCPTQVNVRLPTRVIDLEPMNMSKDPRIVQSDGQEGQYATLSYCWGAGRQTLLTKSNIDVYRDNIPLKNLPQGIQDAITVARDIPVRYLWVDSLCILQDSEEDKATEIANMENIYRRSLVTIVAASSDDVSKGFLQPRTIALPFLVEHPDLVCPFWSPDYLGWTIPFRAAEDHFGTMSLQCIQCGTSYNERMEPIHQRGWALQEQLLSNRLLIYATHALQWRCKAGGKNLGNSIHIENDFGEDPTGLRSLSTPTFNAHDSLLRWMKIITVYSKRKLSLRSDLLPGIAGIAKEFIPTLGANYHAGLWESQLLWQLMWSTRDGYEAFPSKEYRAPSWSWASMDGQITYSYEINCWEVADFNEDDLVCEVVNVKTTPKHSSNTWGEIISGSLTLRGKTRQGWLIYIERGEDSYITVAWTKDNDMSLGTAQAEYDEWKNQEELRQQDDDREPPRWFQTLGPWIFTSYEKSEDCPMIVTCIPISSDTGLILKHLPEGKYQRLCLFGHNNTPFADQPIIDITIV